MGARNGRSHSRVSILVVRSETRLFTDILAEALKAEPAVRLLSQPLPLRKAVDFCATRRPDVVLIEATETGASTLRALVRPITSASGGAPVVLLADEVIDDAFLVAGVEAGASAIVDASAGIHEVVGTVRTAAAGERAIDGKRLAKALEATARSRERQRKQAELFGHLSLRERQVLAWLARGLRNSEIAEQLSISPRTVDKHVEHILDKLDLSSRLRAVVLAVGMEDLAVGMEDLEAEQLRGAV